MNNRLKGFAGFTKYFVFVLIISSLSFLHSCKEDTGNLGTNVLPKNDIISAFQADTTTLLTSMYIKDSVRTSDAYPVMLGSYNDPVFGQVKTSIYTLVSSPGTIIPWKNATGVDTATVDSAVLILPFYLANGYYYGNLDPQTVVVDTLENYLSTSISYYSDTSIKYGLSPIAIKQVIPSNPAVNDTIRIKLTQQWLTYVLGKMSSNNAYYSNFDSLVKGLYITVSNPLQLPGQGGIWYIDLSASFAGIYLYYHGKTVTSSPQPEFNVVCPVGGNATTTSQYFTHIDKNYATSAFYNAHPTGRYDSISANNLVYVQALGGVRGRINFPNLAKNWAKMKPVLINEAEVDMTVDAQDLSTPYQPPANLYLYGTNSTWQAYLLQDETDYPSSNLYNGIYNASNNTYSIVITQYIQDVINGKDTDRGLYIQTGNFANSANRVVLYGAQHGGVPNNQQMKLKIYYTPLKKN